jgi:hypothetical protein
LKLIDNFFLAWGGLGDLFAAGSGGALKMAGRGEEPVEGSKILLLERGVNEFHLAAGLPATGFPDQSS